MKGVCLVFLGEAFVFHRQIFGMKHVSGQVCTRFYNGRGLSVCLCNVTESMSA